MNVWNIKTMSFKIEKIIKATPSEVFDAWLDPKSTGSPWNGVTKNILQPEVDGLFYRMHPSDSGKYELAHYGRFIAVTRPSKLQYTWVSQHTRGLESVVSLDLNEHKDGTRVTLTHTNLPDDEKGRMHEQGWLYYLTQLKNDAAKPKHV
jgi:uncharacterized protein YndB with AHSA1/START domain